MRNVLKHSILILFLALLTLKLGLPLGLCLALRFFALLALKFSLF